MTPLPAQSLLDHMDIRDPRPVAETGIAHIWQVTQATGTHAALKIYKNGDLQDEAPGIALLQAQAGRGAVRIYAQKADAVLMEWLDGPSLGDLVRTGNDDAASRALA